MFICSICTAHVLKIGVFFYCPCCLATIEPIEENEDNLENYIH